MSQLHTHTSASGEQETAATPRGVAWAQVVTLSLTEITSWGILYYTFPVFLGPMEQTLHWSQASLTGAFSLALLVSGLMAVPVGRWLDRTRSPRALMAAGSLLGAAALVVWSSVAALPVFYALWIALGDRDGRHTLRASLHHRRRLVSAPRARADRAHHPRWPGQRHLSAPDCAACGTHRLADGAAISGGDTAGGRGAAHAIMLRRYPATPPLARQSMRQLFGRPGAPGDSGNSSLGLP